MDFSKVTINIDIRLSNNQFKRRFLHESTKDGNRRRLVFQEAWIIFGSLIVGDKGEVRHGSAVIIEGEPSVREFATLSYIGEYESEGAINPTCFNAHAFIPADTFNYLLNLNDEQAIICLSLGFDTKGNIKWDSVGNNGEKYWDITNKPDSDCFFEIAEKVEICTYKKELST